MIQGHTDNVVGVVGFSIVVGIVGFVVGIGFNIVVGLRAHTALRYHMSISVGRLEPSTT